MDSIDTVKFIIRLPLKYFNKIYFKYDIDRSIYHYVDNPRSRYYTEENFDINNANGFSISVKLINHDKVFFHAYIKRAKYVSISCTLHTNVYMHGVGYKQLTTDQYLNNIRNLISELFCLYFDTDRIQFKEISVARDIELNYPVHYYLSFIKTLSLPHLKSHAVNPKQTITFHSRKQITEILKGNKYKDYTLSFYDKSKKLLNEYKNILRVEYVLREDKKREMEKLYDINGLESLYKAPIDEIIQELVYDKCLKKYEDKELSDYIFREHDAMISRYNIDEFMDLDIFKNKQERRLYKFSGINNLRRKDYCDKKIKELLLAEELTNYHSDDNIQRIDLFKELMSKVSKKEYDWGGVYDLYSEYKNVV